MSTVQNITTLKINYLTQAQYEEALSQGLVEDDEIYLTPSPGYGVADVEVNGTSVVTDNVAEVTVPTKVSDLTNDSGFISDVTVDGVSVVDDGVAEINTFNNYGVCNTAKATAAKTVTIDGITALEDGLRIYVFFTHANSATNPTLNVNNLGAKDINLQIKAGTSIALSFAGFPDALGTSNGRTVEMVYDESNEFWLITDYKFNADWDATSESMPNYIKNKPTIPSKVSDLTNDSGFITGYTETDPVFAASAAHGIASSDISAWNGKQDALVSGTNIKTINNESILGSGNIDIQAGGGTITDVEVNGTSVVTGGVAEVTVPTNVSDLVNDSGFITGMEILSYGSSTWADFIAAYDAKKVVYCRASSNSNPASGSQTRLAFMAYVNNATTPTEVEFQYYRSVSTHTASQQGDQVYVYKLNSSSGWSVTTREASVKVAAGTGLSGTYSNGTMTLSLNAPSTSTPTADTISEFDSTAHMNSTDMTAQEVQDFVDNLEGSGGGAFKVLEKTVTGTTNAYGAIDLSLPWDTNEIISVTATGTLYCLPFSFGAATYARVLNDAATYSIAANTSVTLTVRYRTYSL